jgi:tetratricopeptide (TPR) repeat protein
VDFSGDKKKRALICLTLALATLGVYWQVHNFGFVNYDDPDYVTENSMVKRGLTVSGIIWAFTHFYASNWHPLTWISHMLDCQLFGLNAGGPHLVNVFLHTANAILLFLLLHRLTGAQWRSAIVAAVFALHPLHVESVAWISERKDVLSTFFGLLSLLAYVGYVHKSSAGNPKSTVRYVMALVFFALGLLAKPMLVTLPFLMLLLDFWPLQRVENSGWRTFFTRQYRKLALEKWPWFALVAGSCAATLVAQKQVAATTASFPVGWRLVNVIESYFWYFQKTFWPAKLAVFYPLEQVRPIVPFIIAAVVVSMVTAAAVITIRRWPFVLVGWFWFLGTLVPVIGIVQVGAQAMADRYSYVPMVGILIAIVWSGHALLVNSPRKLRTAGFATAIVLAVLATATVFQIQYWKNTITLFSHDLDVTHANDTALVNLGVAYYELGRNDDALKLYRLAVEINPHYADVYKNIALALEKTGKSDEALAQYKKAVEVNPKSADLQHSLAEALTAHGNKEQAVEHYSEAVRLQPEKALYHNDFAVALVAVGKREDALPHYQRAVQLDSANAQFQNNLATALLRAGKGQEAIEHYRAAIRLDPKFAEPYANLGALLFMSQRYGDAALQYSEAVRLSPTNAGIRFNAGLAFLKARRIEEARIELNAAARLRPDWAEPLNAQAWALATSSDDHVRNGAEAVKLAEKAAELTSRQQPVILNTLAAAYAEVGRFPDALATANSALELAKQSNRTNLVVRIERAIALYQSHAPLRENSPVD